MIASIPEEEPGRLAELYKTELLDSSYEEEFNDIVLLASQICNVPISLISLIDADRQWFKAKVGFYDEQTSRNVSFCSHAILGNDILEVKDAANDERFINNPLVINDPNIRYYAGVPLISKNGYKLGALCVIDKIPRKLDKEQLFALKVLATQVIKLIELRIKNKELKKLSELQTKILFITAHDVRNPLSSLFTLLKMQEKETLTPEQAMTMMPMVKGQLSATLEQLNNLVDWGKLQMSTDAETKRRINLSNLVQSLVHELSLSASLKLNILVNNVGVDVVVNADENALSFIIRNLLTNANKFTSEGTITIDYNFTDNKHVITVTDTGVGIDLNKFNPLHSKQNKSTYGTSQEKGSGLGLKLVQEQLQNMQGDIFIESTSGIGTSIKFTLPL